MTGMEAVGPDRKVPNGPERTAGDAVKCGARVALGMAGGYFLGRTRKMKLALMVGGMMAGRRAGGPGELLAQGSKLVSSSPELSRLVGDVRGRLLDAGKDAALAVATRQVESWADRVVGRPAGASVPSDEDEGENENEHGGRSEGGTGERRAAAEDIPARGPDGAGGRSRSGGTATRTRRANSARGSERTARAAKATRPARAGREGRDG